MQYSTLAVAMLCYALWHVNVCMIVLYNVHSMVILSGNLGCKLCDSSNFPVIEDQLGRNGTAKASLAFCVVG